MLFIAHVVSENTIDNDTKTNNDIVAFTASTFSEASDKIEKFYGSDLLALTLLEPIGDNNDLIFLTPEAETIIREHHYNDF